MHPRQTRPTRSSGHKPSTRSSKNRVVSQLAAALVVVLGALFPATGGAQESSQVSQETFLDDALEDGEETSVSGWNPIGYRAGGIIGPAPKRSLQPDSSAPLDDTQAMPTQVVAVASGAVSHTRRQAAANDDFLTVESNNGGCSVVFYRVPQQLTPAARPKMNRPTLIASLASCGEGTALAIGDVNGDGYDDVVVATVSDPSGAGSIGEAYLFINNGRGTSWQQVDLTQALQNAGVSWHASGTPITLADIDDDGALDLVTLINRGNTAQAVAFLGSPVTASAGFDSAPTVLVPYLPVARPIAQLGSAPSGGSGCLRAPGSISRGATGIAVADVNRDGLPDLIVAAPDDPHATVLLGRATGGYEPSAQVPLASGATAVWADDFDGDGVPDVLLQRQTDGCNSAQVQMVALHNVSRTGAFDAVHSLAVPSDQNQRLGTPMLQNNRQSGSFVSYAHAFCFIAPVPSSPYTIVPPQLSQTLYVAEARAQSLDMLKGAGRAQNKCLQSATVQLSTATPGDSTIDFFLSPDGGVTFEPLTPDERAGKVAHPFIHPGSELVWRMDMKSPVVQPSAAEARYSPGAKERPLASQVTLTASLLPPFTYSRAATALVSFTQNGAPRDYLVTAAAQVPNNYGLLTAVPLDQSSTPAGQNFQTVTTSRGVDSQNTGSKDASTNVEPAWNAGTQLMNQAGTSRTLYGAYVPEGAQSQQTGGLVSVPVNRVNLTAAELTSPSTRPTLQDVMKLSNSTKLATLQFINGGMNDTAHNKLYDPGHSSPVVVAPPAEDANTMGTGAAAADYQAFKAAQATRDPVVLMGSNGGMMHAFDGKTGKELWGYTPANLMAKLKLQARRVTTRALQQSLIYRHNYFVDGPITVGDVHAQNRWNTVAVVGQGQGAGADGNSYYFALDVTDPKNPKPLWEATQRGLEAGLTCSGLPPSPQAPQCNNRADQQCCAADSGHFCAPIGASCAAPPPSMGQALSKPAIGRIRTATGELWVAFFASGYNASALPNVGRSIYAINAYTGAPLGTWNLPDLPPESGSGATFIDATLVADVKLVDADNDGFVDRLYVGDLGGRMWKLNTWPKATLDGQGAMGDPNQYKACLVFDAGAGSGGRQAAPIVATAGAAVFNTDAVNIYFGTGGDDRAPSSMSYTFYGLRDADNLDVCSNNSHTGSLVTAQGEFALRDTAQGFRFWAEPTVVDGAAVYFASFDGSLERIQDLAQIENQQSHLYGIAIRPFTNSAGRSFRAGDSVLKDGTSYFLVNAALRAAPMVRGQPAAAVTRAIDPKTVSTDPKDLLIQEGQGNVLQLTTQGAAVNKPPALKQLRWRQVFF